MKKEHAHPSGHEIECDKCGGRVKITSAAYPRSYECACTKCGHRFRWVSADASSYG